MLKSSSFSMFDLLESRDKEHDKSGSKSSSRDKSKSMAEKTSLHAISCILGVGLKIDTIILYLVDMCMWPLHGTSIFLYYCM